MLQAFMRKRYLLLCTFCFLMMLSQTMNGRWIGDFWEHSAVVRELSTHPWNPQHPLLLLNAPHAFYSPYALMAALTSRFTGAGPVTILSIFGLINLTAFFIGFWMFISVLIPKHRNAAAFYGLLLVMTFWWGRPWPFSGFFHIGCLGDVLPYPSTFAAALTLIAFGIYGQKIGEKWRVDLVWVSVMASIVLLSHPITYIFFIAGIISLSVFRELSLVRALAAIAVVAGSSFLISIFWPYFPMMKLVMGESGAFHESNVAMYSRVISRIWPALIGLPLLMMRSWSKSEHGWRQQTFLVCILSAVYGYGIVSEKYSYGRIISYLVIILQVSIAMELSLLESKLDKRNALKLRSLSMTAGVVMTCVLFSFIPLKNTMQRALRRSIPVSERYDFLGRFTGQYDVVLSDLETSWYVPTFGGKVVAALHPLAFVSDQADRRKDLYRFFASDALPGDMMQIIQKYNGKYILIRKPKISSWRALMRSISYHFNSRVVFENDIFLLLQVFRHS